MPSTLETGSSPGIALWPANLNGELGSMPDWLERVEERLSEADRAGASILLMPELACLQWLRFAPKALSVQKQPAWLSARTADALPALQDMARRHRMLVVPGSFPFETGAGFRNRAFALLPDGSSHVHDKLDLTPGEDGGAGWTLTRGKMLSIFEYANVRIGLLVCLDVELIRVVARLAELDVDLLLVPAGTRGNASFHRVFDCAKARAIELRCAVAVVGGTGRTDTEEYVGGAAVFLPCEPELGDSGIATHAGPFPPSSGFDGLFVAHDPMIERIRAIRHGSGGAGDQPAGFRASLIDVRLSLA